MDRFRRIRISLTGPVARRSFLVLVLAAGWVKGAVAELLLTSPSSEIYYTHGLLAGGRIQVAGGSEVTGNVHANGDIHLQNGSMVTGDVTAAGKLILQGTVTGAAEEGVAKRSLPVLESKTDLKARADRVLNGPVTLTDAVVDDVLFVNGDITVRGSLNGTGTLIATQNIRLETIEVGAAGPLLDTTRLSLIAFNDIRVDKNRSLRGVLYAGRDIALQKGFQLEGVVVARHDLSVDKDSHLRFLDLDQVAPEIRLVSPQDGALLTTATPAIELAFSDNLSGVKLETLRFLVDGVDRTSAATVTATGLRFTPSPLAEGAHTIEVFLADNSANEAHATFHFATDTLAPVVKITSPPDGSTVAGSSVAVTGTVTDASPIASATINGQPLALTGGAFTTTVNLAAGPNPITVEATDAAGHVGRAMVTVTLQGDATPPVLAITAPAANVFVVQHRPEIDVTFSDDHSGVDPASLAFTINGAPLAVDCQPADGGARCTPKADLPEDSVLLGATVRDLAGNIGSASVRFIVDTAGLAVTFTSPEDKSITKDALVTVTGTVSTGVVKVDVNGVAASLTGTSFSAEDVPLREGINMLVALATKSNGRTGASSIQVTRDLTRPIVRISSPRDGLMTPTNRLSVTGLVNDVVTGGVTLRVQINGVEAGVMDGTFMVDGIELVPGPNVLHATATDAAGNVGFHAVTVTYQPLVGDRIAVESGNGQLARVRETLPQPLVAEVRDGLGNPVAGRLVAFQVTRNSGTLRAKAGDMPQRIVQVPTDGSGRASVLFTLGDTAGEGNNRVLATAIGVAGEADFGASALTQPAARIAMSMGDHQRGAVGQPLPMPLLAIVLDADGNPVPGIDVTFTVVKGNGALEGGPSVVRRTDMDGNARAVLTLGLEPGINNNVVSASFEGLAGLPATFTSSGVAPGNPADTRFSGVVLDNALTPIPGVEVSIGNTSLKAVTDEQGQFLIQNAPVGHIHIHIDASHATRPETFPPLAFETVTIAGQNNTLGQSILLPRLATENSKVVGGPQDVTLTMPGVEGLSLTVFANSATFPGGARTGTLTISQVHLDKVPMAPPNGNLFMAPAWSIQPPGVHFDPPARITIPNNGLPPGRVIDIFQFDHELNQFIKIGQGTVSEDGALITADAGFGILSAGWGGGAPPPPPQTCTCQCDDGNKCTQDNCSGQPNCNCSHDPLTNGQCCKGKMFDPATQGCCNGQIYNKMTQCCEQNKVLAKNPIANLDDCPNRVPNPNWQFQYDGCSNVSDNPAGGRDTAFSNPQHTGACDEHDRCYQTCWGTNMDGGRLECDTRLRDIAVATCNASQESAEIRQSCLKWADRYFRGLRLLGGSAFKSRQKQVCNCCS
jgi:glucodextranase-like protein/Big-like domain-containing protein